MTIAIVGLGLMGGSFAKTLKRYKIASKIYGYDHNLAHQEEAIRLGIVDEIVDIDGLKKCDMIVLSIPVDAIISFLPLLEGISKETTVIDFGSTKALIVQNIPPSLKPQYIPAHPMTGTEKNGPSSAIEDLYEDKIVVLCDMQTVKDFHKQRVIKIFQTIKMNIVYMDSTEHDIHAGYISHLPHAVSFALANTVMSHENPKHIISLAAGGFKDMSRIAKSSPNMWVDIFRQNKHNIIDGLQLYIHQLNLIKTALDKDDYQTLKELFTKANTLHNEYFN